MPVPPYHAMFNPVLAAIKRLGGSATIAELDDEVIGSLALTEQEIATPHGDRQTEVQYRLAWARTYLKAYGLLENSSRGVWAITPTGRDVSIVEPGTVQRFVRDLTRTRKAKPTQRNLSMNVAEFEQEQPTVDLASEVRDEAWRDELLKLLLALPSAAFERVCQRLLRESGFVEVRVTGRSGDGGIDGVGVVRLGGLLSFPILFQCKRYRGTVGASAIRDFRGAMIGRADRGLVLTTGTFSHEARGEATRDGAPPIDLVDGERLLDKLKELSLGVEITMVERVSVLPLFFEQI